MRGAPFWRALLAVELAAICWLAFDPAPPAAAATFGDKINHAAAFAVLAFSARLAWPRGSAAAVWVALLAYGGFIEVVQTFIPGRSGEWADLAADAAGIAIGLLLHRSRPA